MAGFCFGAIKQTPGAAAGDELKSGIHDAQPAAMLKTRVEISHFAQLRNDPTLVNELLITLQLLRRVILRNKSCKDCFRRQHAALDGRVNSLQPLRIEKPGAVAHQQDSVRVNLRHGEVSTCGDRLCAVTNHLAAFEQLCEKRMLLETLKLRMWIK